MEGKTPDTDLVRSVWSPVDLFDWCLLLLWRHVPLQGRRVWVCFAAPLPKSGRRCGGAGGCTEEMVSWASGKGWSLILHVRVTVWWVVRPRGDVGMCVGVV